MSWNNISIIRLVYQLSTKYPTPSNLKFTWNWGILALVMLGVQIISGILLGMNYVPNIEMAFTSVEHIVRDVPEGWLLRSIHANGASFFFIVIYFHICRGIIYGSYMYPRQKLWYSGVVIFILMMGSAFLGYILPWGQMSLWGATVITNFASTIPIWGDEIVRWLWGGFSVANATLNKFYSLHYLLPFILTSMVGLHIYLLHKDGSSNPLGVENNTDKVYFTPYYTIKDLYSVILMVSFFVAVLSYSPDYFGHPDNYVPANSVVTPEHIVPEWYFPGFYAILRAIPDKTFGVLAFFASLVLLFVLPRLHFSNTSLWLYKPISKWLVIIFIGNWVLLSVLGMKPIENPYIWVSQGATIIYFVFFIVLFVINLFQRKIKNLFLMLLFLSLFLGKNKKIYGSSEEREDGLFKEACIFILEKSKLMLFPLVSEIDLGKLMDLFVHREAGLVSLPKKDIKRIEDILRMYGRGKNFQKLNFMENWVHDTRQVNLAAKVLVNIKNITMDDLYFIDGIIYRLAGVKQPELGTMFYNKSLYPMEKKMVICQ